MCDGAALEEARRENEGLRLGNSRVRDNYEARFVAQQAERDRLRALVEPAEKIREAHMRHPGGLGVYAGTPEYELIMALEALSNPTATTESGHD